MTELVRTVREFEDKRSALILEHTQNKGKRGFSYDATMFKIGELLGFDGNAPEGNGWKLIFGENCPEDKPHIRNSSIHIYSSPSGLCTGCIALVACTQAVMTGTDEDGSFMFNNPKFSWNDFNANNFKQDIYRIPVFANPLTVLQTICKKAEPWLLEEAKFFTRVVNGQDKYEKLPQELAQQILTNILSLETWICASGDCRKNWDENDLNEALENYAEEQERFYAEHGGSAAPAKFPDASQMVGRMAIVPQPQAPIAAAQTEENGDGEDKDVIDTALVPVGQTRLAGEDVMPTREVVDKDGALSKARKAYDNLILKVSDLERETKKIKNDALAPYKDEIDEKNSMVALMTFAADYWNVAALMEEARVKSAHEDPVFCVYAWVTCGKKDVFTAVGTRQDVADKASEVGSQFVFTIAEFEHGEDRGGEELTEPAGTSEPEEQEEEQD